MWPPSGTGRGIVTRLGFAFLLGPFLLVALALAAASALQRDASESLKGNIVWWLEA
jgi:hypothetical protein